jgi:hypothetical protein
MLALDLRAQGLARAENMLLADVFVQRLGTHAIRKRAIVVL